MTKTIIFLCTGNSCRSQMAEGLARSMAPQDWHIFSAGTHPSHVHPLTIEAMDEVGIDIRSHYSKGLNEVPLTEADAIVTLCGSAREACISIPGAYQEHWPIEDPFESATTDKAKEAYRRAREDIRTRLKNFFHAYGMKKV